MLWCEFEKRGVHGTQVGAGTVQVAWACFPRAQVDSHPQLGSLEAHYPGSEMRAMQSSPE